jgi:hypothetical protein
MIEPRSIKPTRSIKVRLLILLLGISAAAVLSITIIAVNATQSQGQSAQQISSDALLAQAEDYLIQLTNANATENDQILSEVVKAGQNLAGYATTIRRRLLNRIFGKQKIICRICQTGNMQTEKAIFPAHLYRIQKK